MERTREEARETSPPKEQVAALKQGLLEKRFRAAMPLRVR
jgi:hypothetical protein